MVSKVKHAGDGLDEMQHGDTADHGRDVGVVEDDLVHAQLIPLSSQEEVGCGVGCAVALRCAAEGASLSKQSLLPALTAQVARKAAHTFPNRTPQSCLLLP